MFLQVLLRRLLFGLAVGSALVLVLCVVVAPWLDDSSRDSHDGIALFARDATLRRTSIGSAVGLIVTAYVFFRRRLPPPPQRPPSNVAGA